MISRSIFCLLLLLLAGCASKPLTTVPLSSSVEPSPKVVERRVIVPAPPPAMPDLDYYLELIRLAPGELAHERQHLQTMALTPGNRLRLAMVYSQPRASLQELSKAQSLLADLLRITPVDESMKRLLIVARMLSDQIGERIRQEVINERQSQQIREGQRKSAELTEKLERLTDIERRLGQRTRPPVGVAP